ncbi:MAG: UvrD-helicase domain-containing protein, partial [Lentisphaeria bacterium]|nr:UvrD-helicase domain-containing protein [Lentisphaeria bacterium]
MLDEEDERPRKKALLQALHSPIFASGSEESFRKRQDIYMILRDSSMGNERSNLCAEVTELLRRFYNLYLEHPRREDWDLPVPEERRKDLLNTPDLADLLKRYETLLQNPSHEAIRNTCGVYEKFMKLQACAETTCKENVVHCNEKDLKVTTDFFLGKSAKLNVLDDLMDNGSVPFSFNRKEYTVDAELFLCVRKLVFHIAASEYALIRRKTQAVYDLMAFFDESYAVQTRRQGLLTFQDILYLINSKENSDYGVLQMLRERLALHIDHYLLDEFQDTSDTQWSALRDLISDVIQWNEESRFTSFFMVADVKQSLYQWRKGNPEIFWRICRDYSICKEEEADKVLAAGGVCNGILKGLNRSFRSTSAVLQMVNDIFDPANKLSFPERLSIHQIPFCKQRENMNFLPHISGLDGENGSEGCSMFLEISSAEKPVEASIRTVCEIIRRIDPFSSRRKKKLSVAVLARKNVHLRDFYEFAAKYMPDLKVSMEGKLSLAESMGYAIFRQLLIYAMHPGDRSASGFFELLRTGEGQPCSEQEIRSRLYPQENECSDSLRTLIRLDLEQNGYSGFFRRFLSAFPEVSGEQEYMDILGEILDQLGEEDLPGVDELLHQLDNGSGALNSVAESVQLMTIHKSKGLGFDIVFYLDVTGVEQSGNFFDGGSNGSLYFMPSKSLQAYSGNVMRDVESMEEKELYEFLCNLYVALTRAKCAQYFIGTAEKEGTTAKTLQFSDVLRASLPGSGNNVSGEKERLFTNEIASALTEYENEEGDQIALQCTYCAGNSLWFEPAEEKTLGNEHRSEKDNEQLSRSVKECVAAETTFLQAIRKRVPECRVLPGDVMRNEKPSLPKLPSSMRFRSMKGAELGTRIHGVFSTLRWLSTPEEVQAFLCRYRDDAELYPILESLFSVEEVLALFRETPSAAGGGSAKLLVEQPFLMRVEGQEGSLIHGIMDRAVVQYDQHHCAVSAEVVDFKSDLLDTPEQFKALYAGQLETYRKALSLISDLPPEKISCVILGVRKGMVIRF